MTAMSSANEMHITMQGWIITKIIAFLEESIS